MKSPWDKLVANLLATGPLTDRRIEVYELQGRYGSQRQEAARLRLMERVNKRNAAKNEAIRRRKQTLAEAANMVADLI